MIGSESEAPEPPGPGLVPAEEGCAAGSVAVGGNGNGTNAGCGECGSHCGGATCPVAGDVGAGGAGAAGNAGGGNQSAALVVFARAASAGARQDAGVGPQAACDFYAACAQHAFAQAARWGLRST